MTDAIYADTNLFIRFLTYLPEMFFSSNPRKSAPNMTFPNFISTLI